jgi:hypothetical protein
MAEVQVTSWREIPSLVTARDGDEVIKIQLPSRFQEAIDEAAMRLGDEGSDAYLEGWSRGPWLPMAGSATEAAESVAHDLERSWSVSALTEHLDSLGTSPTGET